MQWRGSFVLKPKLLDFRRNNHEYEIVVDYGISREGGMLGSDKFEPATDVVCSKEAVGSTKESTKGK